MESGKRGRGRGEREGGEVGRYRVTTSSYPHQTTECCNEDLEETETKLLHGFINREHISHCKEISTHELQSTRVLRSTIFDSVDVIVAVFFFIRAILCSSALA